MPDKICRVDVEHIAKLARLKLSEQEIERYQRELSAILEYVDQLNELDTDNVEPTAHPLPVHTVLREDEIAPSYEPDKALQNAPQRGGSFFAVPKVLDQGESS